MKCPQCGKEMEHIGLVIFECACGCEVHTNAKQMCKPMTEEDILEGVQNEYGACYETFVAIEELSELQKELCKDLRDEGDDDAIAEEMADVEIVMTQLKMIYHNAGRVEAWKKHKLARLERRLKEDYKNNCSVACE